MSKLDDVIDQAQHFRDAPKDCVVEFDTEVYVVTATVAQAELLRDHLHKLEVVSALRDVELAGLHGAAGAETLQTAAENAAAATEVEPKTDTDESADEPAKRGPGRPRKAQD